MSHVAPGPECSQSSTHTDLLAFVRAGCISQWWHTDLLIELTWDAKVSGDLSVYRTNDGGGYRAWNMTYITNIAGNDAATYHMYIDFINENSEVEYAGIALVNDTQYFWRVRTMDSTGIWSSWTTQSFTYAVLSSVPEWDNVSFTPDPGVEGSSLTVSIDVTYFLGVESVLFEFDEINHSMSATADTWSHTWTPNDHGNFTYTVYMKSSINTWSSTSGIVEIEAPAPPLIGDNTLLLIIAAAAVIGLVVIVILLKKRGK